MMATAMMKVNEKQQTRQAMKQLRDDMTNEQVEEKSAAIAMNLHGIRKYKEARILLLYAAKGNEAMTRELIEKAITEGKRVLLPITDNEKRELQVGEARSYGELRKGAFGILEPGEKATAGKIDVAVVPGIAFDRHGHRLGYGLGYYDKLFARQSEITKIGLAYDFQVVERLPREEHDHPMDFIVTESRVMRI